MSYIKKSAKDYIVFAMDVPSEKTARQFASLLSGHVGMFKIGLELFIRSGPELVRSILKETGTPVFLDLKLHDIPETVSRATASVAELGVTYITAHCGENPRMLEAAVAASAGRVNVLGVTVLTSVSAHDLRESGISLNSETDVWPVVEKRAGMARNTGCAGVICSGREVARMKQKFGQDFIAITPGIRSAWEGMSPHDQKRVVTPAQAVRDGADFIVIGRQIRDAAASVDAAMRIAEEIDTVL